MQPFFPSIIMKQYLILKVLKNRMMAKFTSAKFQKMFCSRYIIFRIRRKGSADNINSNEMDDESPHLDLCCLQIHVQLFSFFSTLDIAQAMKIADKWTFFMDV